MVGTSTHSSCPGTILARPTTTTSCVPSTPTSAACLEPYCAPSDYRGRPCATRDTGRRHRGVDFLRKYIYASGWRTGCDGKQPADTGGQPVSDGGSGAASL